MQMLAEHMVSLDVHNAWIMNALVTHIQLQPAPSYPGLMKRALHGIHCLCMGQMFHETVTLQVS